MNFKRNDIVKIKKEVLKKTARQRNRGRSVDGWWLPFGAIEAGRKGYRFEVLDTIGIELYLRWKDEDNKNKYCWIYKDFFELKGNVEAEDW